ncbi:FAM38A protein 1 [Aphelenchoides avenae]|nr:FAM38A protein 1 [Aphelenchus avenae]
MNVALVGRIVALSLPLFVLLRLHLREDYYNSLSDSERRRRLNYGTFDQQPPASLRRPSQQSASNEDTSDLLAHVSKFFTKLWIFVVALVLLLNSLTSPPVLYGLGYFILWTILVVDLHISFVFFRRTIYLFLTVVIIYSSVVLIAVYCYQFPNVPSYWKDWTHLSDDWNRDLGLINFKQSGENE